MELAALIASWTTEWTLGLARAELSKILGRPGHDVGKEFKGDATQGFAYSSFSTT